MFPFIGEFGLFPAYIVAAEKPSNRNKRSKKNSEKSIKNTKKLVKNNGQPHYVHEDSLLSH